MFLISFYIEKKIVETTTETLVPQNLLCYLFPVVENNLQNT
jgi:hypothetical protein